MPKKLTQEEYIEKVKKINSNIEVLGKYVNNRTKILHKCKIDGYEWHTTPSTILSGYGCPKCGGNVKKTQEEYIEEILNINPNIEVIGKYDGMNTKILHRCKVDGYEWYAYPNHILRGSGCPKCLGLRKTHQEYVNELSMLNPNIEVVGKYINAYTKIHHKCKIDGYEWYVEPHSLLHGNGCPKCKESKGEKSVSFWLDRMNIWYKRQMIFEDCRSKLYLPFDFYLPNYNIAIEYQGRQHYEPVDYFGGQKSFESQVLRDKIKREYCQKNNILLFEIPYYSNLDEELLKLYNLIDAMKKEVVV